MLGIEFEKGSIWLQNFKKGKSFCDSIIVREGMCRGWKLWIFKLHGWIFHFS